MHLEGHKVTSLSQIDNNYISLKSITTGGFLMNKKIELFENKKDCCACGACVNACPKNAITMRTDEYGFMYPSINEELCVQCGLCRKVCNFQKEIKESKPEKTFVAVNKSEEQKAKSASGGIFSAIATKVLKNGGIVYGVCLEKTYDNQMEAKHIRISNLDDLVKLQGSKYVQSNINRILESVKCDLDNNLDVLFSGTPCQVDGLKGYLGKEYSNLYTVDIICHGVPSLQFFQDYLKLMEKKMDGNIIDFSFRDKQFGWGLRGKVTVERNGKIINEKVLSNISSYYSLFLQSVTYRENCYSCKYASKNRPSDLTIGDYWGVEKLYPDLIKNEGYHFDVRKGISCILVNSSNGEKLLELAQESLLLHPSSFEHASRYNGQLVNPSPLPKDREQVFNLYKNGGYDAVDSYFSKKYRNIVIMGRIKNMIPDSIILKLKKYKR